MVTSHFHLEEFNMSRSEKKWNEKRDLNTDWMIARGSFVH